MDGCAWLEVVCDPVVSDLVPVAGTVVVCDVVPAWDPYLVWDPLSVWDPLTLCCALSDWDPVPVVALASPAGIDRLIIRGHLVSDPPPVVVGEFEPDRLAPRLALEESLRPWELEESLRPWE